MNERQSKNNQVLSLANSKTKLRKIETMTTKGNLEQLYNAICEIGQYKNGFLVEHVSDDENLIPALYGESSPRYVGQSERQWDRENQKVYRGIYNAVYSAWYLVRELYDEQTAENETWTEEQTEFSREYLAKEEELLKKVNAYLETATELYFEEVRKIEAENEADDAE